MWREVQVLGFGLTHVWLVQLKGQAERRVEVMKRFVRTYNSVISYQFIGSKVTLKNKYVFMQTNYVICLLFLNE